MLVFVIPGYLVLNASCITITSCVNYFYLFNFIRQEENNFARKIVKHCGQR